ncbi:MAG TPA: transglycosylase SLT domain-containing protein [Candidatus Nanoarchaeia archaeon]|nr:transglycosylase SLT domain-containing protein [Candidatus Nanoarchaeia archaeon]
MKKIIAIGACLSLGLAGELNSVELIPRIPPISAYSALIDDKPLEARITANWTKIPLVVTRRDIESDGFFWRNTYFDDWDFLPEELRHSGIEKMIEKYGHLISDNTQWQCMTHNDWDYIPPLIRAMAYMKMVDYWSDYHRIGNKFGFDAKHLADIVKAIVMTESWFEHRGLTVNKDGTRDLGLSGATDSTRKAMRRIYGIGMEDDNYFDPFRAAKVAVLWFDRMLLESKGKEELAIRAYYRGISKAMQGEGIDYGKRVYTLKNNYITNTSCPTMRFLRSTLERHQKADN